MPLWNCENGDANGIADSLTFCPMCGKDKEDAMSAVVHAASNRGGASRQSDRVEAPGTPQEAPEKAVKASKAKATQADSEGGSDAAEGE